MKTDPAIITDMHEFTSFEAWHLQDQQIQRQILGLHNAKHRRELFKMYRNLEYTVTKLSQADVLRRRFGHSNEYDHWLDKVNADLRHLQQCITFASLLDTPEIQ